MDDITKIAELEAKIEHLEFLNADLLRINRERSNADRDLRPKKSHTGYVFVRMSDVAYRFSNIVILAAYRTTLQTPYNYTYNVDQVKTLAADDLAKILPDCGMRNVRIIPGDAKKSRDLMLDPGTAWANYAWAIQMETTLDGRDLYWQINFLASKPIQIIPEIVNSKMYASVVGGNDGGADA